MRVGSTGRGRSPAPPPLRRPTSKTRTELAPGTKALASAAQVQAMLSEVVRIGLHRAEDIATLGDRAAVATRTTILQCKYREEWRCNREDSLLDQLRTSPQLLAGAREEDECSLVAYFRRILHGMVQTIAGQAAATDDNKTPSKAQQLQRAIQLDRIIGRIEAHEPSEICREMVALSRKQLADLLVEMPEKREENAASEAQAALPLSSMVTNVVRTQATYLPSSQPSSSFERLVHAQRYAKDVRTNETLAKAHRRIVAIRRIQRCADYVRFGDDTWRGYVTGTDCGDGTRRLRTDLLQLTTPSAHAAACVIQCHLRRVLARRRVWYLKCMAAHRATRHERRLWAVRQQRHQVCSCCLRTCRGVPSLAPGHGAARQ
ncbi:hypothetical protein SDRG_10572 [Saprolegnia diclina VS20]|uniref:Uncharacterized protein n=1 Tax=Saprolegnia diclina (strain VS20) TaxID=1156394 RepID=T0RHJ4_SAPDV|nr:hypothetical protein SDRG_10572 [Saprolegnia diclina VS20]EQC31783.1 hypothetical protein SDRG_10572 [Saprolegnia diclina VS20]|eukprot:XP_008614790.1 hypothetical protein SDRG_10572 [Saprolegnia diclina VS20]